MKRLILLLAGFSIFLLTGTSSWAYTLGDAFVAVGGGKIQQYNSNGQLLTVLDTQRGGFTTGMAFDVLGNLYITNFGVGAVSKFNNQGSLIEIFGGGYSGSPESILFDKDGNAYVGSVDGDNDIRKLDQQGNFLAQYNVATEDRGSDWIDLAADQCTMYYTSEGHYIKRFDVCNNIQLSNFNTNPLPSEAYALRILKTGGLLVADTSLIVQLDYFGNVIKSYDAPGENCWFALNLDPDGTSFWSADFCTSNVYKFNINTGEQLLKINTGTASYTVFGLVVYGELTVSSPIGLRARVGNGSLYLDWDKPSESVDSYNIKLECFDSDNNDFAPCGTGFVNIASRAETCQYGFEDCYFSKFDNLVNGRLYRATLTAIKNGVASPPAGPVLARPGLFATSELELRPNHPIVFFHGICAWEKYPTTADTWNTTRDFLYNSLSWKFGGTLFYRDDQDPIISDPQKSVEFSPDGDFYTVTFGNCQADYTNFFPPPLKAGLWHQANEVKGFIDYLRSNIDQGDKKKFSIVAHSMGGISTRSYIVDNQQSALEWVADYITYGSPHWGANFTSFVKLWSDGARDLDFECINGRLDFSNNSFFEDLRKKVLPTGIRYVAIRGNTDYDASADCLSPYSDVVVPIDSANFGVIPQSAAVGQNAIVKGAVRLLDTYRGHLKQTNDFSAILCALDTSCFIATVRSPVDMEISEPSGRSISRQLTEIPGASYMELKDKNGHPIATTLIPFPSNGEYRIKVLPKAGALITDTYTLEVTSNGETNVLVQDQQIKDIPPQGFTVSVVPRNQPPVAQCQNVTISANGSCQANTNVDNGSYDPDGDLITITQSPLGPFVLGGTGVTLTVTDSNGNSASCSATVTVVDTTSPTITSVTVSPNTLWPPNHKMVPVQVTAATLDNCSAAPVCTITSVTSNEPDNGLGDGDTANDIVVTGDLTVNLRAERSGTGTGRVYTVNGQCADTAGNSAPWNTAVTVPHDKGK